jgi:hypothetical protein
MTELARCSVCGGEHPVATMVTGHKKAEELPEGVEGRQREPHGWWLEDADALHAEHPRSFFIPPAERRRVLRTGELVRLGFTYGPHVDHEEEGHAERMWVEVVEQAGDGTVTARLRNRPFRLTAVEIGDELRFEPRHVLAIEYADEELGYAQDQWPLVDRAVLDEDRAPDVVVRGPSPRAADTEEWWLLVRSDSKGPGSDSAGMLTDRFPGLAEPLRAGAGVWELAEGARAGARWRRIGERELEGEGWQELLAWVAASAEGLRRGVPVRRELTSGWSVEVDESFASRVVDGDLQMVSAGPPVRTIWVAMWTPPEEERPEDVLANVTADGEPPGAERLDHRSEDGATVGMAFWYREDQDGRETWTLSTYTARRGSYLQLTCSCDDPSDHDWAVGVWRSLFAADG